MSNPSEMDLRDYGRILMRRKWWVVSSAVIGVVIAMVLNVVITPAYRATVRLQISQQPTRSPLTGAWLDNLHADMPNPRAAEQVANTVADLFVRAQAEQHNAGASSMVAYLTSQIQQVRASLDRAEQSSASIAAHNETATIQMKLNQL